MSGFRLFALACLLPGAIPLAGCALGPRPATPIRSQASRWNGQDEARNAWPSPDWWSIFGSAELDRLITDAQARNSDIAEAEARLQQADGEARVAGAALLPTIDFQPIASTIRSVSPAGTIRRYSPLGGVVSASYEVDLWGRLHDAHHAAQANAQAAAFDVAVVRLAVTAGVAETYFRMLAVQDQLRSAERDAGSAALILDGLRIQRQHGIVTGLQVAEQSNVAAGLAAAVPSLEAQLAHLVDALAILTGHLPEELVVEGGSLDRVSIPNVSAGLPSDLLFHRPDIQEAERNLAAADANISVARKSFLPSIALTGSGGIESVALSSAVGGPTSIFNIGLSMLQPIFSGGRLRGSLQQANGRYAALAAIYVKTVHQAYGDTEDALATLNGGKAEVAKWREALAAARSSLEMSRRAVSAGTTDTLALLAAQQALAVAQSRYTQARLDQGLGAIDLYKALGGGWAIGR